MNHFKFAFARVLKDDGQKRHNEERKCPKCRAISILKQLKKVIVSCDSF